MKNNLSIWFIRLRWFAFIAQIIILASTVLFFKVEVNWQKIALILSALPLSNIITTQFLVKKFSAQAITICLIFLDTIILSAILYLSGGPANPFTIVFLLHLVLTAVLLDERWTWVMALTTCAAYVFLFFFSPETGSDHQHHHGSSNSFSLHLYGMLFAFITVAVLVAYFLNKIITELRLKELRLQKLEQLAVNSQRLASLVTITAGTAHELGTPLSTIAVVCKELELELKNLNPSPEILEDLHLIQQEVGRCKDYLSNLSEKTGDLTGETHQSISARDLISQIIAPLYNKNHRFEIEGSADHILNLIPVKSLTIAIRALVKNSLDASSGSIKNVTIRHQIINNYNQIEIIDFGLGMDPETLEMIGEPFFSQKDSKDGLGLGVYLSKLVANQIGGELTFTSTISQGTCAKFRFPVIPCKA